MKTYRFLAFQDITMSYKGLLEIEAESPEEAQKKLKAMSQQDLAEDCFNWGQTEDEDKEGKIDIDSLSIHEI